MDKKYFFLIIACGIISSITANEVEIGLDFFNKGDFNSAKEHICRGYKANSGSSRAQYAYAKIISDASEAERIYKKIVLTGSAPDSLKAEVFYSLGCLYYVRRNFEKADSMFLSAEKIGGKEKNKHLRVLSAFQKGNSFLAESLCVKMSAQGRSEYNIRKHSYYLGNVYLQQNELKKAFSCYTKAIKKGTSEPWTVPAQVGAYLCARFSNDSAVCDTLYNRISEDFPFFLEADLLHASFKQCMILEVQNTAGSDQNRRVSTGMSDSGPENSSALAGLAGKDTLYVLQIGAFNSPANAGKLAAQLKKMFDHVSIYQETKNGVVYFKVMVGEFSTEKDALSFGKTNLEKEGYHYRVVRP